MFTASRVVGDCPGYQDLSAVGFVPVQCDQSQLLDHDHDRAALSSVDVDEEMSSSIAAPTVSEMCEALRMGSTVDMSNPAECFRVLFYQNSVMLREAIVSRRLSKKSSGRSSFSSLTGSGESSGRASVGSQKRTKLAPPKVFDKILFAVRDHKDAPPSAGSTQCSVDLSVSKALFVDNDANF
jgi:hypothetical protein